jgi:hypothetical protein
MPWRVFYRNDSPSARRLVKVLTLLLYLLDEPWFVMSTGWMSY